MDEPVDPSKAQRLAHGFIVADARLLRALLVISNPQHIGRLVMPFEPGAEFFCRVEEYWGFHKMQIYVSSGSYGYIIKHCTSPAMRWECSALFVAIPATYLHYEAYVARPLNNEQRLNMAADTSRWFGMRLTDDEKSKIERLATKEGSSQKRAVLDAVEDKLRNTGAITPTPGSMLDKVSDLVGTVGDKHTPRDLASNKKHLDDLGESSMSNRQPRE